MYLQKHMESLKERYDNLSKTYGEARLKEREPLTLCEDTHKERDMLVEQIKHLRVECSQQIEKGTLTRIMPIPSEKSETSFRKKIVY